MVTKRLRERKKKRFAIVSCRRMKCEERKNDGVKLKNEKEEKGGEMRQTERRK